MTPRTPKTPWRDLRGVVQLGVAATVAVTDGVERLHRTIQAHPGPLGRVPARERTAGITGMVYRTVRGSTRLVGRGLDRALGLFDGGQPPLPGPRRDAWVSALNGMFGDQLVATGNPLAIPMALRLHGQPLDPDAPAAALAAAGAGAPRRRLLVLIHGLCMNDRQWQRNGHEHGAVLAQALDATALHLHYNTGLPIGENGRALAALLERLLRAWPDEPPQLDLIGHSMGGLVARSACWQAERQGLAWRRSLQNLVFLGTPHQGAPLERGGRGLDLLLSASPYSAPLARLGQARSAGIQDLRHGTLDAAAPPLVPLPDGVACFAVAALLGRRDSLADQLLGDGLVPLDSALGRHSDPARALALPQAHQWICRETGHLDLLSRPEVSAQLLRWLHGPG